MDFAAAGSMPLRVQDAIFRRSRTARKRF